MGLCHVNPFEAIRAGAQVNTARGFFVTAETTRQLLDACDPEWRLIVALCRYGGVRCPSELAALAWQDINWELGRFLVRAPKTEHLEDRGERWVPLFPELRPYLEQAWDRAPEGAVKVIRRPLVLASNLRTQLLRIIKRAGLKAWPRLFQNMRSSRETELCNQFPLHVACNWMGNSPKVAAAHYLQITDQHFRQALIRPGCEHPHGNPAKTPELPQGAAKSAARDAGILRAWSTMSTEEREAVWPLLTGDGRQAIHSAGE
jgi:integrase